MLKAKKDRSLAAHSCDTELAFLFIFKGRLLDNYLEFFKCDKDAFISNGRAACLFHDLGKANPDFQRMLEKSTHKQALRHEQISALLVQWLEDWIREKGLDFDAIMAGVLSHHLKADPRDFGQFKTATTTLKLHFNSTDVYQVLSEIVEDLIEAIPPLPKGIDLNPQTQDGASEYITLTDIRKLKNRGICVSDKPLWLAVKAAVIIADSVASIMYKLSDDFDVWESFLDSLLDKPRLTPEMVKRDLIEPHISRYADFTYHEYQRELVDVPHRLLINAPCGTGKTLAAYKWVEDICKRYNKSRVIYLYPTQVTAIEGYKDYMSGLEDGELLIGSDKLADYYLGKEEQEEGDRLSALKHWDSRYIAATYDQFLGFMNHAYKPFLFLPLLVDAVVIIDEVHILLNSAVSSNMRRSLFTLLNYFNCPVLLMSATITATQKRELTNAGVSIKDVSYQNLLNVKSPRYVFKAGVPSNEYLAEALGSGKKILWISNTVTRCVDSYIAYNLGNLIFHSRYRKCDFNRRRKEALAALNNQEGCIVFATQVCEQSFDIDVDILITDIAPPATMIQRLGRCNRLGKKELGEVWINTAVTSPVPYDSDDFQDGKRFAEYLIALGQGEIPKDFSEFISSRLTSHSAASFVDSGYWAIKGNFRENDYMVNAVLASDLEEYLDKHNDLLLISLPKTWLPPYCELVKNCYVLPDELYSQELGVIPPSRQ